MRLSGNNDSIMPTSTIPARKRPADLTVDESLLIELALSRQKAEQSREQLADRCAADWNTVHASVGSFADEYTTL